MNKLSEWIRNGTLPAEQRAKQFLNKAGIKTDIKDPEKFLSKVENRFPESYYSFCELSNSRATEGRSFQEIYDIKNEDKEFSLLMSSLFQAPVWINWIKWFLKSPAVEKFEQAKHILDLGSDNGIITCFLAAYFPEAKITGIDRCKEGKNVAYAVSEKLDISNVEFKAIDAAEYLKNNHIKFDLINSLTFFKEALLIEENNQWALDLSQKESNKPKLNEESIHVIESTVNNLNEGGLLLCCERIHSSDYYRAFLDHFHATGIKSSSHEGLFFQDWQEETEMLPICFFEKAEQPSGRLTFAEAHESFTNLCRTENNRHDMPVLDETYSTWMLFESLTEKQLLGGALLVYKDDEGALMTTEVWSTCNCTVWFSRTVRGYGEIIIYSGSNNQIAFEKLKTAIRNHSDQDSGEIIEYKNVDFLNLKLIELGHPNLVLRK
jgi:hypothetical protein